ncbi:MAG: hypothetical protein AAGL17_24230, partial [Cyanobacteria bacterium J06576_12]
MPLTDFVPFSCAKRGILGGYVCCETLEITVFSGDVAGEKGGCVSRKSLHTKRQCHSYLTP